MEVQLILLQANQEIRVPYFLNYLILQESFLILKHDVKIIIWVEDVFLNSPGKIANPFFLARIAAESPQRGTSEDL